MLAAVFRAINDMKHDRLKSRNIHSEIVFSLSPNNNVGLLAHELVYFIYFLFFVIGTFITGLNLIMHISVSDMFWAGQSFDNPSSIFFPPHNTSSIFRDP